MEFYPIAPKLKRSYVLTLAGDSMRRLYYALPFLLFATGYVFWDFRETPAIIVLLNWLTFFMGHRYGGESKEGEELVAVSITVSSSLWLGGGLLISLAEFLALFVFILEFMSLLIKARNAGKTELESA
jgi:hypothetical protein